MTTSSTSNVTTTYGVGTSGGCIGLQMCFVTIQTKIMNNIINYLLNIIIIYFFFLPAKRSISSKRRPIRKLLNVVVYLFCNVKLVLKGTIALSKLSYKYCVKHTTYIICY